MINMHRVLIAGFLIVTAISSTANAMKETKVSMDAGEEVYRSNCINCHGSKGKGDGPIASSLNPPPANLTNPTTQNKEDEALLQAIQDGKTGTSMPAWKNDLSTQQILDVLAYLRTLQE